MLLFNMTSPCEVVSGVSQRMRRRRIDSNFTQRELAARSNVSYSSLRLFEETGKISFESLVKIAFVLEAEGEFESLFPSRAPRTINEIIEHPVRQRARRK